MFPFFSIIDHITFGVLLSGPLGLAPLPLLFRAASLCIVVGYVGVSEGGKKVFYRSVVY